MRLRESSKTWYIFMRAEGNTSLISRILKYHRNALVLPFMGYLDYLSTLIMF